MYDLCASFIFQPTSKDQGARMQLAAKGEGSPQDLPNLVRFLDREQTMYIWLVCYDESTQEGGQQGISM